MISRPALNLRDQLIHARKEFGLSLIAFAAELRIRPEWLSKILNGHQEPSYNIGLRFEDFLRRRGLDPNGRRQSEVTPSEEAKELRQAIASQCTELMDSIGDDLPRLRDLLSKIARLRIKRPEPKPKHRKADARSRVDVLKQRLSAIRAKNKTDILPGANVGPRRVIL